MAASAGWCPERGDVIWIDCNPQAGREMKNVHPFLVLSPKNFNASTSLVIGLPMTTSQSNENNPFAVKFIGADGVTSYILTHQPKSYDWKARDAKPHKMKRVPEASFELSCESLNQIIAIGS